MQLPKDVDLSLVPVDELLAELKRRSPGGAVLLVTANGRNQRQCIWGNMATVLGMLDMARAQVLAAACDRPPAGEG